MRKSRAVIFGTSMFPLLMAFWQKQFEEVWQDEVDRVYIAVSHPEHISAYEAVKAKLLTNPKIQIIETGKNWPESLNMAAKLVKEDSIMFAHDDTIPFKKGVIDQYFARVETEDVVVTTSQPIYGPLHLVDELIKLKYPDAQYLDHCFSFYANFLFISREMFQKTRGDFGEWSVKIYDYCPELDFTPKIHPFFADTNFKIALDLFAAGAKFEIVERRDTLSVTHEANPVEKLMELADGGWFHIQSLSYHVHGYYFDLGERERLETVTGGPVLRKIHNHPVPEDRASLLSWTLKLAWIKYFIASTPMDHICHYRDHSALELVYIMRYFGIKLGDIDRMAKAIKIIFEGGQDA